MPRCQWSHWNTADLLVNIEERRLPDKVLLLDGFAKPRNLVEKIQATLYFLRNVMLTFFSASLLSGCDTESM